jgi:transcriptional regulator with XRE-family HTH domain
VSYIGEVLETTRRARSMTQEQLADLTGMTQATLSRYEKGMRDPDEQVIAKIAHLAGFATAEQNALFPSGASPLRAVCRG